MAFQRKCFAQIDRLRAAGCTIVFVSHDMGTIISLCDRVLLYSQGKLARAGQPKEVVDRYIAGDGGNVGGGAPYAAGPAASADFDPQLAALSTIAYAPKGAEIFSPRILTLAGEPANLLRRGQEYQYVFDVRFDVALANVRCGMLLKAPDGRELGGLTSAPPGKGMSTSVAMEYQQRFRFRCNLLPGTYFANAGVVGPDGSYLHRIVDAAIFSVQPEPRCCGTGSLDISPMPAIQP
jgi:lipopolysaccharide transport system ATP-binding protein